MLKILWQLPQSVHGVVPFYTQILLAIVFKAHARSYFWPGRAQKMRTSLPLSLSLGLLLDLVHREIIAPQIAPLTDHSNLHQPFIFLVPKNAKLHEIHTSIFRIHPWKCGIFALILLCPYPWGSIPGGGGVLPYMGYMGMCRCEGYGFQAVYSRIGYINQRVWV